MLKKTELFFFFLLFSIIPFSTAMAGEDVVTCPSVDEIKRAAFHYWLPLYKEGEELASNEDVNAFRKTVTDFDVARWSTAYLESAHCFYRGNDAIVDQIVFAQKTWNPVINSHWFWVKPEQFAECQTSAAGDCRFLK